MTIIVELPDILEALSEEEGGRRASLGTEEVSCLRETARDLKCGWCEVLEDRAGCIYRYWSPLHSTMLLLCTDSTNVPSLIAVCSSSYIISTLIVTIQQMLQF